MYARVTNTIAQNEMQLTMWIETFKNIGSKKICLLYTSDAADE